MVTHADATNPDGNPVTIQVGVLATDPTSDDGYTVTLGLADTSVVTVTDPTAVCLADLLTEAVAERAIYAEQASQRNAAVLANQLGHAVLTQRQWSHLRHTATDHHAQRILRTAAPQTRTHSEQR